MASYSIAAIRAIPPFYAGKLKSAGIRSTKTLLERAATPRQRKALSEETGIPVPLILDWANISDLTRVSGIAVEYAELLVAAGVDTVPDLARRNPANLAGRLCQVNGDSTCNVRLLPSEKRVARWIATAKRLSPGMDH